MDSRQIIKGAVDELTGKMIYEFTIPVKHVEPAILPKRTLWDRVLRKPPPSIIEPETERSFQIYPCVAINQYRIAGEALTLPVDLLEDETQALTYVPEHLPTMIYIIAAAIQNNYLEPDKELIQFLERNLDNIDILKILAASLQNANMQSFLTSIVLMNGMASILKPEANPIDGRELIASHTAQ